ncbi:unnamed protein product, partial [Discosporangium mesarthrocarpum]
GASGRSNEEEQRLKQQRKEYGRRGISLTHFEANTSLPHLTNVDEDPFRHNRFIYLLKKPMTVFGPHGDVRPLSLSVVRKHCSIEVTPLSEASRPGEVILTAGKGDVFHNGRRLRRQEHVSLY